MTTSNLTIGKISKKTGLGIETIRFYEKEGLIEAPRRQESSGYREFDLDVVKRLLFIQRAKALGFSLKEIKELFALKAKKESRCASVKTKALAKIESVESKIKDLERIKKSLHKLVDQCHDEKPTSECPILDAMEDTKNEF